MTDTPQNPVPDSEHTEDRSEAQARLADDEKREGDTNNSDGVAASAATEPLQGGAASAATEPLPGAASSPQQTPGQWAPPPPPPGHPHRTRNIGIVAALVVGALVGGASGAGVTMWASGANQNGRPATSADSSPTTVTVNDAANASNVTAVAAKAGPSVVTVSVTGSSASGTGSGVILTSDGYVVTNAQVVTLDGASSNNKVQVQTYDGHLYNATVVGTDPIMDLAVIKIEGGGTFQPAQFADSSKLNVGNVAIAIGAPLGLANTVTNGIVSALDRSINVQSSAVPKNDSTTPNDNGNGNNGPFNFWQFGSPQTQPPQSQSGSSSAAATISLPVIQTDAAINPGNSGGALLNADGQVIGINVAIASTGTSSSAGDQSGNIGVGFAIPSNLVKRIATELKDHGTATHGLLGASVQDASNASITSTSTVGALIVSVTDGGAAKAAGLQKGDVVVNFNGAPITSATDLTAQVRSVAAGTVAQLSYIRGGDAHTVTVTLGSLKL